MTAELAPVLVGIGQAISHWDGNDPASAPSPIALASEAIDLALEDTTVPASIKKLIDTLVFVRTMQDSVPAKIARMPFGRCENPPATVAEHASLNPSRLIYSEVGGHQPQALVNEFAKKLFDGEVKAVALCGGEAAAALKLARKKRLKLDWSSSASAEMEDRGLGAAIATEYGLKNGLGLPTQTYAIFEHAIRNRLGLDREAYSKQISELLAPFSEVAAKHPCAQFKEVRSADFLGTLSKENYRISDPYLRWHVAQESVNQGAAVIMTTVGAAKRAGIPEDKYVYLHGHASVADRPVVEREDLSRSKAIDLVLNRTLSSSELSAEDVDLFDIYSCFPCVVQIAAEVLGVDWRDKLLTVTGGLPFFGGAGNNYSMHAIATMVEKIRAREGATGLILANGGFMSKEAAGLYCSKPMENWAPVSSEDLQKKIESIPAIKTVASETEGKIESYSVVSGRHSFERGYVSIMTDEGRALAKMPSGHRATLSAFLHGPDPLGRTVSVRRERNTNYLKMPSLFELRGADAFLSRSFKFVKIERRDRVLEITLNRPKSYNALHAAAHFELAEIFDEFERDPDLWVAIITGSGEKAFCAGNDLVVTASGGDMSVPRSGFGGLCERFDRQKPVIAAVNGAAMGGGLEIALACDLAIMDENATCALPEVKVGLFAAAGGVQRLTRQIGRKAAMELILTGRTIGAHEALNLGVINSVAQPGEALAEARLLADQILKASPSAVRASKRALNAFEEIENLEGAMKANVPIMRELFRTKDLQEGVTAFAEKREPKWTNS